MEYSKLAIGLVGVGIRIETIYLLVRHRYPRGVIILCNQSRAGKPAE